MVYKHVHIPASMTCAYLQLSTPFWIGRHVCIHVYSCACVYIRTCKVTCMYTRVARVRYTIGQPARPCDHGAEFSNFYMMGEVRDVPVLCDLHDRRSTARFGTLTWAAAHQRHSSRRSQVLLVSCGPPPRLADLRVPLDARYQGGAAVHYWRFGTAKPASRERKHLDSEYTGDLASRGALWQRHSGTPGGHTLRTGHSL